jgi:hypothetical protein
MAGFEKIKSIKKTEFYYAKQIITYFELKLKKSKQYSVKSPVFYIKFALPLDTQNS